MAPDAALDDVNAVDAGYRPAVHRVRSLAAGDRLVLVRCAPPGMDDGTARGLGTGREQYEDPAETLALLSVYAWAGARLFATNHPHAARQALDMVDTIRGVRPPALARRGLA